MKILVIVLRRLEAEEELFGPPQHSIIRIICSHDSPDEFRAFEQLHRRFVWPYTILYGCHLNNGNPCTRIDRAHHILIFSRPCSLSLSILVLRLTHGRRAGAWPRGSFVWSPRRRSFCSSSRPSSRSRGGARDQWCHGASSSRTRRSHRRVVKESGRARGRGIGGRQSPHRRSSR